MSEYFYRIGEPGKPWGPSELATWLQQADKKTRYYGDNVVPEIEKLKREFDVIQYGALGFDSARYPLFCVRTRNWDSKKRSVLVTGGVHGYETSGVHGALLFCKTAMKKYAEHFNILVCPCVSPWGYECVQRWNYQAIDPNRSFMPLQEQCRSQEAGFLVALIAKLKEDGLVEQWTMHIDLHETTNSDQFEFRPAKAARDACLPVTSEIPDGFYLVADSTCPQADWHRAMIDAVRKVTRIAPTDGDGRLIDEIPLQEGVVAYDAKSLFLCMGVTNARYVTTTEVYPDSSRYPVTAETCNEAQVACVTAGMDYIISNQCMLSVGSKRAKVAVIVGYGPGVSDAVLSKFASPSSGVKVALIARSIDRLNAVASKWTAAGAIVKGYSGDLSHPDQVPALLETIANDPYMGPIDICIYNAAVGAPYTSTPQQMQDAVNINITSMHVCYNHLLPTWRARRQRGVFLLTGGGFADNGAWAVGMNFQAGAAAKAYYRNFAQSALATHKSVGINVCNMLLKSMVKSAITAGAGEFDDSAVRSLVGEIYFKQAFAEERDWLPEVVIEVKA